MQTSNNGIERHFCATTYVVRVTPSGGQVLLHKHPKLGTWLPPGGHVEENESPLAAAEREVNEEVGIKVRFMPSTWEFDVPADERTCAIPAPQVIQEELISPGHYHIDFIYVARQVGSTPINPTFQWTDKISLEKLEMFENSRVLARKAIKLAEERQW